MVKRLIPFFLALCFLAACGPPQSEQDTDLVALDPNTDLLEPQKPYCEQGDKGPTMHSIADPVDASSPLTLTWDIDCKPNEYEIKITHFGNEASSIWISFFDPDSPPVYEWTKLISLEPATDYQWQLHAFDMDGNALQNNIEWAYFRTGPLCGVEELVPPTLVSPADGTIDTGKGWGNAEEVHAIIKYPAGECLPEYFEIDYSWSEDFIGEDSFNLSGPKLGKLEGEWIFYGDDSSGTQNCHLYYWRARAMADSGNSDWSETFTFYLDVYGNCYKFPEFKALKNANCRRDPWAGENYVGVIWEGDTAELLGLNKDATWGMFKLKNELECWVNMVLVEPDPPDADYFPGFYPVLEHGEQPEDLPDPGDDSSDDGSGVGCMAPSDRTGALVCQIPCPDPKYAARVCP